VAPAWRPDQDKPILLVTSFILTNCSSRVRRGCRLRTVVVPADHEQDRWASTYNAIASLSASSPWRSSRSAPFGLAQDRGRAECARPHPAARHGRAVSTPLAVSRLSIQSRGPHRSRRVRVRRRRRIQFVLRSARRAAGPDKSVWAGLGRAFTGSRTRTAAYFVTSHDPHRRGSDRLQRLQTGADRAGQGQAGQTASVAGYTLTYKGMTGGTGPQDSTRSVATFAVSRGRRADSAPWRRTPCVSGERGGGARRDPRTAVRGPLRGRRRAVRPARRGRSRCAWSFSLSCAGVDRIHSCSAWAPPCRSGRGAAARSRRRAPPSPRPTPTAAWTARRLDGDCRAARDRGRGLRKTFGRREVLRAFPSAWSAAASSASSAPTAPERPRRCACSPRCSRPARARSGSRARCARGPHARAPHYRTHLAHADALPGPHRPGEPCASTPTCTASRTARPASRTFSSVSN